MCNIVQNSGLGIYIYNIYICVCIYIYVYVCVYIYILPENTPRYYTVNCVASIYIANLRYWKLQIGSSKYIKNM